MSHARDLRLEFQMSACNESFSAKPGKKLSWAPPSSSSRVGPPAVRWEFHDTPDPLTRYVRDRRQSLAIRELWKATRTTGRDWSQVLVVCGGVGGEGTFLKKLGFRRITVADTGEGLIRYMGIRDRSLAGVVADSERLPFADDSFDLVLVQDGIHHLKIPALGVAEMLRVTRRAIIVIEPHEGLVARLIGTKVEKDAETGALNFVFRWNRWLFRQVVSSYWVDVEFELRVLRFWDHSTAMLKLFRWLPGDSARLRAIQISYWILKNFFGWAGNMFVGIAIKNPPEV